MPPDAAEYIHELTHVTGDANRSKTKDGPDAKELLKKYGSAYLITSISLALVSFSICYVRVPPH